MAIKRIQVSNFKSFKRLDLELGQFNVIIGANASGKSNFVQIFRFIRDISNLGLDNAISLQGSEYLTNIGLGRPQTLSLKISLALDELFYFPVSNSVIARIDQADYEFSLTFGRKIAEFEIAKDSLNLRAEYSQWKNAKNGNWQKGDTIGHGTLIITNERGTPKFKVKGPRGVKASTRNLFPPFLREKLKPRTLLLEAPFFFFPPIEKAFGNIAIYDFDPKLSKKAVPVAGKSELEEDGSNLSLVLKSIVENKAKKRKFSNLMKDLLPFVEDLSTDKFADRSLLFKLQESYFPNVYFPASFISDGTVNVSALLIALYFEEKGLSIIEEPERNIHPHLISRVMDMMKDAAKNKQTIVTTHSPEVVKYTDVENVLLASRDEQGFSTISKPSKKKEVKVFLKNQLGLDELYVQNLLED